LTVRGKGNKYTDFKPHPIKFNSQEVLMPDMSYQKLARVLDTLPNGFPSTESGVEYKLLQKIFSLEHAEIFCDMRLSYETVEDMANRTGRVLKQLAESLEDMRQKGLIMGIDLETVKIYKMLPWVFGIYEFQIKWMDREFAELCEEYNLIYGEHFFKGRPQLMQVVPIEKELQNDQESLPYERVSAIIEAGHDFYLNECICKKEKRILDNGCDKPHEVCLAIAPVPDVFDNFPLGGRVISKDEAFEVLQKSEEAGLVHLTSNVQTGHYYICNCCGCCCGVLRSINDLGLKNTINSSFFAEIDSESCISCGVCAEERCQVNAITEAEDAYQIDSEKCIGCGLCISTCPTESIRLWRKDAKDIVTPPVDEDEWFTLRSQERGVDFSRYK
jgi:electron transport complex protein RnfB